MASINRAATFVVVVLFSISLNCHFQENGVSLASPPSRPSDQSLSKQLRDICVQRQTQALCAQLLKKDDLKTLVNVTSYLGVKEADKLINHVAGLIRNKGTDLDMKLRLKMHSHYLRQLKKNIGLPMVYMSEDPKKQRKDLFRLSQNEFGDANSYKLYFEDNFKDTPLFKDPSFLKTFNVTQSLLYIGGELCAP